MNGEFFLVGGWDRFRALSDDGVNWQYRSFSKKEALSCSGIASGAGRCAMLFKRGYFGKCILELSGDGKTWESHDVQAQQVGHSLVYFRDRFIVCTGKTINAGHKPQVVLTEDGNEWSRAYDVPGRSIMTHYAEAEGRLVGIGPSGMAAVTPDGINWQVADLKTAESMISLAFGKGYFVGGGLHGQVWRSENGLDWQKVHTGDEGEHLNAMIWDGQRFVGIGLGATYQSSNSRDWERVPNRNAPLAAARNARGLYLGNQWKGRALTSHDGIDWKDEGTFDRHVERLACVQLL